MPLKSWLIYWQKRSGFHEYLFYGSHFKLLRAHKTRPARHFDIDISDSFFFFFFRFAVGIVWVVGRVLRRRQRTSDTNEQKWGIKVLWHRAPWNECTDRQIICVLLLTMVIRRF